MTRASIVLWTFLSWGNMGNARRLDGSTARRLDGSTARRLDGSTARRLDGSTARRLDGSTGAVPGNRLPACSHQPAA
jgi:hypothetical protein